MMMINLKMWDLIALFKRFIDNIFLVCKGTKRQFSLFVELLNKATIPFGIRFGSWDIGKEVNFLDVTLYLDNNNKIQNRLYRKPTDARNYLRTDSFHPPHVFDSVVYSQLLRVMERNSKEDTLKEDISQLRNDLQRSGHKRSALNRMEPKAWEAHLENSREHTEVAGVAEDKPQTLIFSVNYFSELQELKKVVSEVQSDIEQLIGPSKTTFATRKGRSIANRVLRNGAIGRESTATRSNGEWSQKCNDSRCQTCKLMADGGEVFKINNMELKVPKDFNCKTNYCIYCAQCLICNTSIGLEDSYYGQTVNKLHIRVNGHRDKFNEEKYQESALAIHAFEKHPENFTLDIFRFCIVKSVHPLSLNREEFRYIEK